MSESVCLTCKVSGCQGLQYNPYTQKFYCPVFSGGLITDNQTIIVHTPNAVTSTKDITE